MATRELIRNETCWLLANGRRADVWNSPWIPWLDWNMFRAAFNPLIEQNSVKVSTLIGADGEGRTSSTNRWFFPSVASSLNLIKRLPSSREDLLVWKDATNGLFTPSVAYKSIIKHRWGDPDLFWNRIRKLKITERLKLFLWKIRKDILPFGSLLRRIFDEGDIGEFNRFSICLLDELWTARNRAFHDRVNPFWRGVLASVQRAATCLLSAWDSRPNSEVAQHVLEEIYVGKTVLFVDAAFKDLRAAAGIVVSESEGSYLEAMTVTFDANQPLEAESWAVFHAIKWCQSRG
uniref:Reverse transcriptase zinc-binding domain-containing protein n=1 Tax=Cannabis sativa TaxID=3483 RepID=A0A803Q1X8_CANSA